MKKLDERFLGDIYIGLILIVFILALPRGYYDVSTPKLMIFYISAIVVLIITLVTGNSCKDKKYIFSPLILLFLLSVLLTTILNYSTDAMLGTNEYGVGALYMCTSLIIITCFKFLDFHKSFFIRASVYTSYILVIMACYQTFGFDLFNLWSSIEVDFDNTMYIATLGNRGFFGCYMVAVFSMAIYMYINETDVAFWEKALGIFSCAIGLILANTSGTLIGALIGAIVILYISGRTRAGLRKIFEIASIVAVAWLTFGVCYFGLSDKFNFVSLDAISKTLISPIFTIVLLLLSSVGIVILNRQDITDKSSKKFTKIITIIGIVGILLIPISIVIYTFSYKENPENTFSSFLYFDAWWGTGRGFIWSKTFEMLSDNTIVEWIFGNGIGSYSDEFVARYGSLLMEQFSAYYNDAHNIFLQWVYEYGLFGLANLVAAITMTIENGLKSKDTFFKYMAVALIAMIVCQSFLVVQDITLTIIVLYIAIINSSCNKKLMETI